MPDYTLMVNNLNDKWIKLTLLRRLLTNLIFRKWCDEHKLSPFLVEEAEEFAKVRFVKIY